MKGEGDITTELTVWCGSCELYDQQSQSTYGTRMAVIEYWRDHGWRKTKGLWQCRRCRTVQMTEASNAKRA